MKCPNCGAMLNKNSCEYCGYKDERQPPTVIVQHVAAPPPPPSLPPPLPAPQPAVLMCALHRKAQSVAVCKKCGKAMCTDCSHESQKTRRMKNFCPECQCRNLQVSIVIGIVSIFIFVFLLVFFDSLLDDSEEFLKVFLMVTFIAEIFAMLLTVIIYAIKTASLKKFIGNEYTLGESAARETGRNKKLIAAALAVGIAIILIGVFVPPAVKTYIGNSIDYKLENLKITEQNAETINFTSGKTLTMRISGTVKNNGSLTSDDVKIEIRLLNVAYTAEQNIIEIGELKPGQSKTFSKTMIFKGTWTTQPTSYVCSFQ